MQARDGWTDHAAIAYTTRMSAPTLLWLHIHQYEQFEDVRIHLSPRENLLLGVNGAGKTRLLKLLRAVLTLEFGELLGRPFDVEFELQTVSAGVFSRDDMRVTGRVTNIRAVAQSNAENISLQPPMELTATISYRSAEALIRSEIRGNEVSYHREEPSVAAEKAMLSGGGSLKPTHRDLQDPILRETLPKVYPRCEANYLSESDHEFRVLSQILSFTTDGKSITFSTADEKGESLGVPLLWDLLPLVLNVGKLARERFKEGLELSAAGTLTVPASIDKTALPRLFIPLGVRTVRLIPKVTREKGEIFECRGIEVNVEFLDGTRLSESELTFGQKRYLYAGIVFAMHPGVPVLVDELDNGLHPGLIATLLDLWKDRQVFLVSHNKLVIDHTNFSGPRDVQDKIHIIRRGEDGRQTVVVLDESAAHEVYEKISVAIQSPSDVLRAEGLW